MTKTFTHLQNLFRRRFPKKKKSIGDLKTEIRIQEKENAEVKDRMAIERTKMANERTFLAYLRTSLSLVIAGLAFLEFFDNNVYKWIGGTFIPAGLLAGFFGLRRFKRKQERIRHSKNDYVPTSPIYAEVAEKTKEEQLAKATEQKSHQP